MERALRNRRRRLIRSWSKTSHRECREPTRWTATREQLEPKCPTAADAATMQALPAW